MLQELDLRLNPVTKNEPDYRLFVVHMLVNLRRLGKHVYILELLSVPFCMTTEIALFACTCMLCMLIEPAFMLIEPVLIYTDSQVAQNSLSWNSCCYIS